MTSALQHPALPGRGKLSLKVVAESLVVLASCFPAALAVWGASRGSAYIASLGALPAIGLLGLGWLAWRRPMGGGASLFLFGGIVGFFALSLVALAPDPLVFLLVVIPAASVVTSGILFWLSSGASGFGASARRAEPPPRPAPAPALTWEDLARRRLTGAQIIDVVAAAALAVGPLALWFALTGDPEVSVYYPAAFVVLVWRIASLAFVASSGATPGMRLRGLRAELDSRSPPGWDWALSQEGLLYLVFSGKDGLRYRFEPPPP